MPLSFIQATLVLTLAVALGFVWSADDRSRWRSVLEERFVYGVPWGTAVTVTVVVAFYLLAQGGARHWFEPVTLPFVSWSYYYPIGMVTSGIAHGSPDHLVSNMAATIALAPIVEYAWGHYPPSPPRPASSRNDREPESDVEFESEPAFEPAPAPEVELGVADGGNVSGSGERVLANPWVRALVVFPIVLLAVAFVTALFSLGPALGFSGAVFAIAGFAVVTYPLTTLVGIVAASALGTLYDAVSEPVVRATIESGTPGPPSWASIAFQAHALGFLIGVVLGIALLSHRGRRPNAGRVLFATALLGLVQSLWLIAWGGGDDVYVLYRGVGVVLVLALSILITIAVAGSGRPLPRPLSVLPWAPSRRLLAGLWLLVVTAVFLIGFGAVLATDEALALTLGFVVLVSALLALPAVPPLIPRRWRSGPTSRRQAAIGCLIVLTVLVAVPSVPFSMIVVGDDTVPGSGGVEIGDYTVTYEENATSGHAPTIDFGDDDVFASQQSGLIVVSPDRQIWTVGVRPAVLEHEGNDTVHVGGLGWREAVQAERSGWTVIGNESAYVVDLTVDDETTRSYTSDPVQASAVIDDRAIEIVPDADAFLLRVTRAGDGTRVGETPIPDGGETATVGDLEFVTENAEGEEDEEDEDDGDDTVRLFVESDGTRVLLAERETYD